LAAGQNKEHWIAVILHRLALQSLDKRLKPTEIQVCAAVLDPAQCNRKKIVHYVDSHHKSRKDLISKYLLKYKIKAVLDSNVNVSEQDQIRQVKTLKLCFGILPHNFIFSKRATPLRQRYLKNLKNQMKRNGLT
jgi:hypothetical protein